jgi:hypothetical protein
MRKIEVKRRGKILVEIVWILVVLAVYMIVPYMIVPMLTPEVFHPRVVNLGKEVIQTNFSFNATQLAEMIFKGEDTRILADKMRITVQGRVEEVDFRPSGEVLIRLGPPYKVKVVFGLIEVEKTVTAFCKNEEVVNKGIKVGNWITIRGTYSVDRIVSTNSGISMWLVTLEDCQIIAP